MWFCSNFEWENSLDGEFNFASNEYPHNDPGGYQWPPTYFTGLRTVISVCQIFYDFLGPKTWLPLLKSDPKLNVELIARLIFLLAYI
jgi:hypothetical protein